jgi:hypothetical protein
MSRDIAAGKNLTEREVDDLVIAQAGDESAWERPVHVRQTRSTPVAIPPDLAARAAFLARVHRTDSVEEWLTRVIRERVELEEAAYMGAKEELLTNSG